MSAYLSYESCPACSGKAQPGTVDLLKYLMNKYPGTYSLGVFNCRLPSLHSCGKALDLGIPLVNGNANTDLGDPIVVFLDQYANEFGLMGQIWNRVRYDLKSPKGRVYTGPHPHHDHNHIEQRLWHAQNLRYADYVRIAGEPIGGEFNMFCKKGDKGPIVAYWQRVIKAIDRNSLPKFGVDADYGDETAEWVGRLTSWSGVQIQAGEASQLHAKFAQVNTGKGEKGDKGDPGTDGKDGAPGKDGKPATLTIKGDQVIG